MTDSHHLLNKLGDVATSAVGNAAGATVDPKTGLTKLKKSVLRPGVLVAVALASAAYVCGRSARR